MRVCKCLVCGKMVIVSSRAKVLNFDHCGRRQPIQQNLVWENDVRKDRAKERRAKRDQEQREAIKAKQDALWGELNKPYVPPPANGSQPQSHPTSQQPDMYQPPETPFQKFLREHKAAQEGTR